MFSAKSVKIIVIAAALTSILSGCRWWKNLTASPTPTPSPLIAQPILSDIPFGSREPDSYQAEIVVATFAGDEKSVKKIFVAKSVTGYFNTFNAGEKSAFSSLKTNGGSVYLISNEKKIFAEESPTNSNASSEHALKDFLTTEWLNEKASVAFENLGAENGLMRFRVNFENAQNSEILIYVDENLKIPVRQEFYNTSGEQKKLLLAAEILNFKIGAEEKYFEVPAAYRKVSQAEFDKIVFQNEQK